MRNIFDVGEIVRVIRGDYRGNTAEVIDTDGETYRLHMPDNNIKEYSEESLRPINKKGLSFDVGDVLEKDYQKAYDLFMHDKLDDAYDTFRKILKHCEECEGTDLDDLKAKCKRIIGAIRIQQGEVVEGMKILNEAIKTLEVNENYYELGGAFNTMGSGFEKLGLLDQAVMYESQALAIAQKLNDKKAMGYQNINIANNYLKMKQPKDAELYLKNAFKMFNTVGEKRMLPAYDYLMGILHQQIKDHNMAKKMFNKAITGAKKNNDFHTLSLIYESYADLHQTENNKEEEEKDLDLAISCYRREGNQRKVKELLERKMLLKKKG